MPPPGLKQRLYSHLKKISCKTVQPEESNTSIIIREFNRKLSSWGDSDSWTSNQFKVLEDLIYEKSHIRIHANTLKRFFQEHTSNPQLSTRNALCIFLGYTGYNDFVMRRTEQAQQDVAAASASSAAPPAAVAQAEAATAPAAASAVREADSRARRPWLRPLVVAAVVLIAVGAAVALWLGSEGRGDAYDDMVRLTASAAKGVSPLTVTIEYDVPEEIVDDTRILVTEANGDVVSRPLTAAAGRTYSTFVYPGLGFVRLVRGDRVIKELQIESRRRGWQIFVSEGYSSTVRNFTVDNAVADGHLSLPAADVPVDARTDKLFVSYSYYQPELVDGDNFTVEARVRNSEAEGGIPCFDTMFYVFAGSQMHGFALNEDGYSYLKFISGDKSYTGDRHDFSFIKYNPREWHSLRIDVRNRHTTFSLDGTILLEIDYDEPMGMVDELTLRFKGSGAVDYIRLYDADMKLVFEDDFDATANQ